MHTSIIIVGILGGIGTPELILIALVVLLLFGGSKIPELMKGVGKGVRGFKEGLKGIEEDMNENGKKEPDKTNPNVNETGKQNTPAG
jgi:sec-independent protein translocase protein TatA